MSNLIRSISFLMASIMTVNCVGCDANKPPQTSFLLITTGKGWRLTAFVNDVPAVWDENTIRQGANVITPLVRNGDNKLLVRATRDSSEVSETLHVKVTRGTVAAAASIAVDELEIEPDGSHDSHEVIRNFRAKMPLKWTWESAEAVKSLSASDRGLIMTQIKALGQSLAAKDLKRYHEIRGAIVRDMAKCLHMKTSEVTAIENKMLSAAFAETASVEAREETRLRFVVCGGCVWVSGRDREWVVRMPVNASKSYYFGPFLFAKIAGQWRLVN